MFGACPFSVEDGELNLRPEPMIPAYLLNQELGIRAKFLGHTDVVYHVPEQRDFYPGDYRICKMELTDSEGHVTCVREDHLAGQDARDVRDGKITVIQIWLEETAE